MENLQNNPLPILLGPLRCENICNEKDKFDNKCLFKTKWHVESCP